MNKKQYEEYLNNYYQEQSFTVAFDDLVYLTNAARGQNCSKTHLKQSIIGGTAGTLVRRLDPIAFEVGRRDYAK